MNAELRQADARFEVTRAARAWHAAGTIDARQLEAIVARSVDDRRRTRTAFRILFFVLTLIAGVATWAVCMLLLDVRPFAYGSERGHAVLLAALAAAAAFGARFALERVRLRAFGVEEALVALALGFECAAFALGSESFGMPDVAIRFGVAWLLAASASVAAWRWGIAGSGAVAAAALLFAFVQLPAARILCILAALPLALAARRFAGFDNAAVAHRRRAFEVAVVALVALYLTLHPSPFAARLFSEWNGRAAHDAEFVHATPQAPDSAGTDATDPYERREPSQFHEPGAPPDPATAVAFTVGGREAASWLAITLLPLALGSSAFRRRDRAELALAALGLLATAAAAADRLEVGPDWLVVTVAGAALLALALGLRRLFASRPGRTAAGFTDRALFDDADRSAVLDLAAVAVATPDARVPPSESAPTFRGEGGDFGGGGASGKF